MNLTFNPFKLRRQVRYYATLYSQQAEHIIAHKAQYARLLARTRKQDEKLAQIKALTKQIETELIIAQNQVKVAEILRPIHERSYLDWWH